MISPILEILIQIAAFALVAVVALYGFRAAERAINLRRRLGQERGGIDTGSLLRSEDVRHPVLKAVSGLFLTDISDRTKLRRDLADAGFDTPTAPALYVLTRFSLAIGLPLVFLLLKGLSGDPNPGIGTILAPLVLTGVGLLSPRLFINIRAETRRIRMENQFPDALDLITVCVEAGLGLEAAFLRVGRETKDSHPDISREFDILADELAAGRNRSDALRAMGDRMNVESVKAFVALLVQTEALGVSVAQSLRTYSHEMRETRLLRAEEKAMRIPVLMTMPIVACFMPVTIVALLLPPAIDVYRTLLPVMRGTGAP